VADVSHAKSRAQIKSNDDRSRERIDRLEAKTDDIISLLRETSRPSGSQRLNVAAKPARDATVRR
jgi:hypothetical protein